MMMVVKKCFLLESHSKLVHLENGCFGRLHFFHSFWKGVTFQKKNSPNWTSGVYYGDDGWWSIIP